MSSNQQYVDIPALAEDVAANVKKIAKGKVSSEQMNEIIESTRELYDRLVILRYKAFENEVKAPNEPTSKSVEDGSTEEGDGLFAGFKLDFAKPGKNDLKAVEVVQKQKVSKKKGGRQEAIPMPEQPLPFNNPNPPKAVPEEEAVASVEPPEEEINDQNQTNLIDEISDSESPSLNDQFSSPNEDETLGKKLGKSSLGSLKEGIGINQKFLFMNDLFGGEHEAYHTSVDKLDACANLPEAMDYVNKHLKPHYDWSDSDTVNRFMEMIERRFL